MARVVSKITDWNAVPVVLTPRDILDLRLVPGGKNQVYALFHRTDFPAVRHGKKLLVSRDALRRWFEGGGQNPERSAARTKE